MPFTALFTFNDVSAIGASQAGVALLGTVAVTILSWAAADAAATMLVGCAAIAMAVRSADTNGGG